MQSKSDIDLQNMYFCIAVWNVPNTVIIYLFEIYEETPDESSIVSRVWIKLGITF